MTDIEDFIPVYPSLNDPHIQSIITSKQEFREVAAKPSEQTPKPGGLYLHQKFSLRFSRMSDFIFNIQEPGTGKTCAFFGTTEYYRRRGGYQRAVVLERGPNLIVEVKNQLVQRCTSGEYVVKVQTTERGRRARITRQLNDWYEFRTYAAFANILRDLSDEEIIERYSRCIFVFDEAHNIANGGLPKNVDEPPLDDDETESGTQDSTTYEQIYRLTRLIRNSKITVVTATPMINRVEEIVPLMNLLIPPGHDPMPSPAGGLYKTITLEELEPYIRGKVTYVRALESSAQPRYMGQQLEGSFIVETPTGQEEIEHKTIVFPVMMGDIQQQVYLMYVGNPGPFSTNLIQASTFTFPGGEIGGVLREEGKASRGQIRGLTRYVEGTITRSYGWKTTPDPLFINWPYRGDHPSFQSWIYNGGDTSNLRRISAVFANIVDIERVDRPAQIGQWTYPNGIPGCAFIYIESLGGGGGIIMILILQLFGFSIFSESNAMIGDLQTGNRRVSPSLVKKPRVALITSELPLAQQAMILELFLSPENVDGEYIKVLIGSRVTRDGISVYHCLRAHMVIPSWHFSGMIQATNRVLRTAGHDEWKKKRYSEAIAAGYSEEAARDYSKVVVDIYRYSSRTVNQYGQIVSINDHMYRLAEDKEYYIRRIFNMLKICAVDNQLNRTRNILPPSQDGSIECDYQECDYPIFDPLPNDAPIDYSTYDILYSDEKVEDVMKKIIEIVSQSGYVRIDNLYETLMKDGEYRRIFIDRAIGRLAEEKISTTNSFGVTSYIATDGELVYAQREYPTDNYPDGDRLHKDISIYSQNIVGVLIRNLEEDLRSQIDLVKIYRRLDELVAQTNEEVRTRRIPPEMNGHPQDQQNEYILREHVKDYLKTLTYEERVKIAEELVIRIANPATPNHPADAAIYDRFKYYVFQVREPIQEIQKELRSYILGEPDVVWIHSLGILRIGTTAHDVTSKFRSRDTVKIYNPSENLGWRNPLPHEFHAYRDLMNTKVAEILAPFEARGTYGTIYQDMKFRIRDKTTEDSKASTDGRSVNRGRECVKSTYENIVYIMYHQGIDGDQYQQWIQTNVGVDPNIGNIDALLFIIARECTLNDNDRNTIKANFTADQIHYFYFLVLQYIAQNLDRGKFKSYLCNRLYRHFYETGALLIA